MLVFITPYVLNIISCRRKSTLKIILTLLIGISLFTSCSHYSSGVKEALNMAGDNKEELIKVLKHFEEDSFKYAAASFLIENLAYQHSVNSSERTELSKLYVDISEKHPVTLRRQKFNEGLKNISNAKNLTYDFHVHTLSSDYLIPYIDKACSDYLSKPWHNDYPFEIFAEYILPYYMENEGVNTWRDDVISQYDRAINTLSYEKGDLYEVEDYCSHSDSIIATYTASGGKYVKLHEGDSLILNNIKIDYNCMLSLLLSHFNGNDSLASVSICLDNETITKNLISTRGWSKKHHKKVNWNFNIEVR
jgi:hypothetical protein